MVCLDTSVLIAMLRKEKRVIEKFEKASDTRLSTTPINLCELYNGAYASRNPTEELAKIDNLVNLLNVLQFTVDACRIYGQKINQAPLKNEPIGDLDSIIACIAMSHGEALATRDVEHFRRVPGLVLQYW